MNRLHRIYIGLNYLYGNLNIAQDAKFNAFLDKHPEILYVWEDRSLWGRSWFIISVQCNYNDSVEMSEEIQKLMVMKHKLRHIELHTFILRTDKPVIKPFSWQNLEVVLNSSKLTMETH